MSSLLLLGFVVGMRHAVETDHVAAVASLATRSGSTRHTMLQGAAWGVGHTMTLFLIGSAVLMLDVVMPERLALGLEFAVGFMLIALGADVLRRLNRDRINRGRVLDPLRQAIASPRGFPLRALAVGLMHGMAGSAALILLTLQQVHSVAEGLAYIALFGIGSIAGMAALSALIALPLRYSAHSFGGLHNGFQAMIGCATVALGFGLVVRIALFEGLFV